MTIAVTGSMAFDYIMSFNGSFTDYIMPEQLERLSISVLVDSLRRERGGTAGNIAYNLTLLGQKPLLMASVGSDAADYIADLAAHGVDTSAVLHVPDVLTASFFVSTDRGNRQIANFFIGAMAQSGRVRFESQNYRAIKLATISPNAPQAMVDYVTECKSLGVPYVYDPSQQIPLFTKEQLIDGIDGARILIVNDYEFELIKQRTELTLAEMRRMTESIIITKGEYGSTIYTADEQIDIPAITTETVLDPTGAGDAYRAGLMAGLVNRLSLADAGRLGTLTATYAIESHGTQKHRYSIEEFAARYAENFEVTPDVAAFFEKIG